LCKVSHGLKGLGAAQEMKQANFWAVLCIWSAVCVASALIAAWQGYGGPPFAVTLTVFSFLLAVMLFFAARGVAERMADFGPVGGLLLCACVYLGYLGYLLGTGSLSFARVVAMAGLIFVSLGLAIWAREAGPGAWQDFLVLMGIWMFVKFGPSHWLWPYPGGKLAYIFTVLAALGAALGIFVMVRRVPGIGYSIGWGKKWVLFVGGSFLLFACAAIPLGLRIHFIEFAPQGSRWSSFLGLSVAILLFTAWPEEFLFRGLLQNLLGRVSKNEWAGWWTASILFGFSHIRNLGFPNWKYVVLASIAGLFYGWLWKKTGSIFASALLHTAVDVTWHLLFRTP
jgi:membrane protease YdiL (CAAX protease family)